MKESEIQKSITDYLDWQKDLYYFRSGSGQFKTDRGWFKTGRKGCPDITICIAGLALFVEVKNEKGKLSPEQKEAQKQIQRSGGIYIVARSIDDVIFEVEAIKIIKKTYGTKKINRCVVGKNK